MRIKIVLLCGFICVACLQAQSPRVFAPENNAHRVPALFELIGSVMPHWSGQTLIGIQDNSSSGPLIYLIDRQGRRDQFLFTFPDAATIYIYGFDIKADGAVALVGGASSAESRAGSFLALVSPDRKHQTVVRTWPYVAQQVVFVPNGSLWTVGYTFHDTEDRIVQPNIMAHFDNSGKLLGSSTVAAKSRFGNGRTAANNSFLRTSQDRIGWFTNGAEYIEYSFEGRELDRFDGPETNDAMASSLRRSFVLSADNEVLFQTTPDNNNNKIRTWTLDRANRQWASVQFQDEDLPAWGFLLGFDGGTLITTGRAREMRRYRPMSRSSTQ